MSVTIIYGDHPVAVASATAEGNNLWLSLDDLRATTGWELKPQGVCLGEVCVPIPAGRDADFVGTDGTQFNLAALARQLNQPAVHDDAHAVWSLARRQARATTPGSLYRRRILRSPIWMANGMRSQSIAAGKFSWSRGRPGEAAVSTCQCGRDSMKHGRTRIS